MTDEREEKCHKGSQRGVDSETEEIFFSLFFFFFFFGRGEGKFWELGDVLRGEAARLWKLICCSEQMETPGQQRAGQEKGAKED